MNLYALFALAHVKFGLEPRHIQKIGEHVEPGATCHGGKLGTDGRNIFGNIVRPSSHLSAPPNACGGVEAKIGSRP